MTNTISIPQDLSRKISWRLGPLMILMYLANQLDRANIGYAALTMNADLGLSSAQYGLAASLFFLGYILCDVPSNLCLYRFGARLWMSRIMVTWGTLSSFMCLVPNAEWLYVARFFLGVFEAGLFPGMVFYLTLWLPARERVWMMSLFVAAIPLTGVVGAPISTWIIDNVTIWGFSGWRAMFLIEGFPAIVLGVFVFFYLPDGPWNARWLTDREKSILAEATESERSKAEGDAHSRHSLRTVVANYRVWALGCVYFGINAGILALLYFLPQVIRTFETSFGTKFSITQVGLITAIPFSFATVAMLVWGRKMRTRTVTSWHVAAPMVVCGVALSLGMALTSPYAALAAFALGSAGCFCSMTTFWQLPTRFLAERSAAAGIGFISSLGVSAGFVLPTIIGWAKDVTGHFAAGFYGVSLLLLIGAVAVTRLESSKNAADEASLLHKADLG